MEETVQKHTSVFAKPKNLRRKKIVNSVMLFLCVVAAIISILPLFYIFFYTTKSGISSLNWDFFTQMPKPVGESGGGMANGIIGTLILVSLGSVIGIPVGVLAGIYVTEYSGGLFSNLVKFVTDELTGVSEILPVKAAQYGSGIMKKLEKIAKPYPTVAAYLQTIYGRTNKKLAAMDKSSLSETIFLAIEPE